MGKHDLKPDESDKGYSRMENQNHLKLPRKKNFFLRHPYWITLGALVVVNAGCMGVIANNYHHSLRWSSGNIGLKMADQPVDILYDTNAKSKQSKVNFTKLYRSMMNSDGRLTTKCTNENMHKLEYYLDSMTKQSKNESYHKEYNLIHDKVQINKVYGSLFNPDSNQKSLKNNVTPATVQKCYDETQTKITSIGIKHPDDKFISDIIQLRVKLAQDSNIINGLLDKFDTGLKVSFVEVGKGKDRTMVDLTVARGYYNDPATLLTVPQGENLHFVWNSLDFMNSLANKTENAMKQIVKKRDKKEDFENKVEAMKQARLEWDNEKSAYLRKQEEAKQAKEESSRDKEESVRESVKQESEQKKAGSESSKKKSDSKNQTDTSKANSSSEDSGNGDSNSNNSSSEDSSDTSKSNNAGNSKSYSKNNQSSKANSNSKSADQVSEHKSSQKEFSWEHEND